MNENDENEMSMSIPHLFRCPISLELFKDPVTLSTGQTYDRSSIQQWLAAGNRTCPVTMQKLHDPSFVPNHTLRHLINQWFHHHFHHHHLPAHSYFTTVEYFSSLKHNLQSHQSTKEIRIQTLEIILTTLSNKESSSSSFSVSSTTNSCLVQLGFLPLLLEQLFGKAEFVYCYNCKLSQDYFEKALSCVIRLLEITGQSDSLNNVLKEDSKLESFLFLLENGSNRMKNGLCELLKIISSPSSSPENKNKELLSKIGTNQRFLHQIINTMLVDDDDHHFSDVGLKVLSALSSWEPNRQNLVQNGAIIGLITYISKSERREKSMAALAMGIIEQLLGGVENAAEEVMRHPNGVRSIVKMVFKVSDHEGSENAINALMMICSDSLRARESAISGGILTQLLLLLQSQCSSRTKSKARMLLKMLRSKWVEEQQNHV